MKQRIFLMPGFGEDTFCFDEILPYLANFEIINVDYRSTLDKFIFPFIKLNEFTKQLVLDYKIQKEDKIIGHSMGGYFAFSIHSQIGTQICMVASFSDTKKLFHFFPKAPRLTQLNILSGFIKSNYLKAYLLKKIKDQNTKKIQSKVIDNFSTYTNIQLAKLMEMTYENKVDSNFPSPLRIHDKKDRIVMTPDEAFIQIEGGHFCLNLFPKETFDAMKDFLNQ